METILSIRNLNKKFGRIHAVNDLSFDIQKGTVYGMLGPNGSGKSTTLGIILNVVNRTSGDFSWFDGRVSTHEALKRVGAIIERPNFYPYMSAVENLKLVCKIKAKIVNILDNHQAPALPDDTLAQLRRIREDGEAELVAMAKAAAQA